MSARTPAGFDDLVSRAGGLEALRAKALEIQRGLHLPADVGPQLRSALGRALVEDDRLHRRLRQRFPTASEVRRTERRRDRSRGAAGREDAAVARRLADVTPPAAPASPAPAPDAESDSSSSADSAAEEDNADSEVEFRPDAPRSPSRATVEPPALDARPPHAPPDPDSRHEDVAAGLSRRDLTAHRAALRLLGAPSPDEADAPAGVPLPDSWRGITARADLREPPTAAALREAAASLPRVEPPPPTEVLHPVLAAAVSSADADRFLDFVVRDAQLLRERVVAALAGIHEDLSARGVSPHDPSVRLLDGAASLVDGHVRQWILRARDLLLARTRRAPILTEDGFLAALDVAPPDRLYIGGGVPSFRSADTLRRARLLAETTPAAGPAAGRGRSRRSRRGRVGPPTARGAGSGAGGPPGASRGRSSAAGTDAARASPTPSRRGRSWGQRSRRPASAAPSPSA